MAIRELISKTGRWLSAKRANLYEPLRKTPIPENDNLSGLIARKSDFSERTEALQMIQNSFEQLVEKLGAVNEHLDQQVEQNAELVQRLGELAPLLQNFPEGFKNQKAVIDSLVEQLKVQALKSQQFTDAVEKIPAAAEKQTDAISEMSVQLAASSCIDAQLAEGFGRFNSITDKLKDNVEGQTESIIQMSRTFSASDRYLKYVLNTQHKRFMWVFVSAMGVCVFAIAVLLIVIFMLK
jgi:DNA repair exonuclease SbcCD ATPase subunit